MPTPDLSVGTVEIALAGRTYALAPTLRAAEEVDRRFGGIAKATEALLAMNLGATATIIRIGAKLKESEQTKIKEALWEMGLTEVTVPVARYLASLANGGRPPKEEGGTLEEDGDEGNG